EEHNLGLPSALFHSLQSRLLGSSQPLYQKIRRRLGLSVAVNDGWMARVVAAQVAGSDPDIIFNCDVVQFPPECLWEIKDRKRLLIGECASPVPPDLDLRPYDLLVSCVPNYVDRFRTAGARAELLRHAFEPSVLRRLDPAPEREGVVFLGSVGNNH